MMFYNIAMALAYLFILMVTHMAFNNGRAICIWTCKIVAATYIWFVLWVITQMQHLPEWQMAFQDSIKYVMNSTAFKYNNEL